MTSAKKICGYLEKKARQAKDAAGRWFDGTFYVPELDEHSAVVHDLSSLTNSITEFHPSQSSPASSGQDNKTHEVTQMKDEYDACDQLDVIALKQAVDEYKKQVDTLTTQNKDLTAKQADADKKLKEATDALNQYKEAEKKGLVEDIAKAADYKPEDLAKKPVEELRVIHDAISKVKKASDASVKNVRNAGGALPTLAPNITADGKIDPTKSIMGNPVKQADGSFKWVIKQ